MAWEEYAKLEKNLVRRIKNGLHNEEGHNLVIMGIYRGGMVIARSLVSKLPGASLIIINPHFLEDEESNDNFLIGDPSSTPKFCKNSNNTECILLIADDISDSGATLEKIVESIKKFKFAKIFTATLVVKTYTSFLPDFYAKKDDSQDWIVFPWEQK